MTAGLLLVSPPLASAQEPEQAPVVDQSRTEYLADRLREDPVFISDHIPRVMPAGERERLREIVDATGVPTYLMALPAHVGEPTGEPLLGAVHDRLGADGLYVVLADTGIYLDAQAYGYDLPTTAATRAVTFEMDHTAGPVRRLERFVEVLTSEDAEEIYREAEASSQAGDPLLAPEDRAFLAGAAATGVPLGALAVTLFVLRSRRKRRAAHRTVAR